MKHLHPAQQSEDARPFLDLSLQIERRLRLARWLRALERTALPLFVPLLLSLLAFRVGALAARPVLERHALPAALALVLLWMAVCFVCAHFGRRSPGANLALFDERSGGEEIFSSAYALARAQARSAGAELHLLRARAALARARSDPRGGLPQTLRQTLPLPPLTRSAGAALSFLLLAAFGVPALSPPPSPESVLNGTALVGLSLDAEEHARKASAFLSEQAQEQYTPLEQQPEGSASKLADPKQQSTPPDVLAELGRQATQAEALAGLLGAEGEELSSPLLAELERHADTAALARAVRSQQFKDAARRAAQLARRLRTKDLSLEAVQRIARAFRAALAAAAPADRTTLLGSQLARAEGSLQSDGAQGAATELDELSRRYQEVLQRQNARNAHDRLADAMRTSAHRATDRNQAREPEFPSRDTRDPHAHMPGRVPPPAGETGAGERAAGTAHEGGAPMPGSLPGSGSRTQARAADGGPRGRGSSTASGTPSLEAGSGSAPHGSAATPVLPAGRQESVVARAGSEGASELTTSTRHDRDEDAVRRTHQIAAAFSKAQEQALSCEPLPLSRRAQVLRYFTALRKQLEAPSPPDEDSAADAR